MKLARMFGKRKVVLQVDGYSNPLDYLVAEGYLAKINNVPLRYEDARTELITGLNIPTEVFRKCEVYYHKNRYCKPESLYK